MPFEIVPAGTHIDFIGKRRICGVISIALLAIGATAAMIQGVKLGIDFAGGTEIQIAFSGSEPVDAGRVRAVVTDCGVDGASVVEFGSPREYLIKFGAASEEAVTAVTRSESCPLSPSDRQTLQDYAQRSEGQDPTGQITNALAYALSNAVAPATVQRQEFVGPRVGEELRSDGIQSLLIASALILVYVAFRFSTRFAPGAIVALVHDVGITAGIFVVFGMEFDLKVLAALLAILGYSLNDTIIIYDRIRENMELRTKHDLEDVLNRSVNQTLSRTVLTSGTTMAAVLALLFMGGEVLRPFALAMTIGIVVGTYSSIYIAAPTLLFLETRFAAKSG